MTAPTYQSLNETGWPATTQSGVTRTTGSHSVTANDVLVAVSAGEHQQNIGSLTVSGGTLTWTERQAGTLNNYAPIDISTATVDTDKSMTETVTRSVSAIAQRFGVSVLRFTGSGGVGASNKANATTGNPSVSVTTTQDNSDLVVAWSDWAAVSGTPSYSAINGNSGIAVSDYPGDGAAWGMHVARYADVGTAGAKTVTVTGVTNPKWQIVVVEVKGSAAAPAASILSRLSHSFNHMLVR